MSVTLIGAAFLAVLAGCGLLWRRGFPWLLSAALGLPASAALLVAGQAVTAFYLLGMVAAAAVVLRTLGQFRRHQVEPGRRAFFGFVLWSTLITLLGPTLFEGTDVLAPRGGIDNQVVDPSDLTYTISNFAQLVYLWLGAAVLFYLAHSRGLSPRLLGLGLTVGTVLSSLRLVAARAGVAWPTWFDNSPNVLYIDTTPTGEFRLRGIFAEPSALAGFSIAAIAYFLSMAWHVRGPRRLVYLGLAGLCLLNLSASYSGTAVAASGLLLAVAGLVAIGRLMQGRAAALPVITVGGLLAAAVVLWRGGAILGQVLGLVQEKLISTSYVSRTTADVFSLELFVDTYVLGVGLGSNRPSTFLPMLLSCVGLVGTLLLVVGMVAVTRRAWRQDAWRPTAWVVVALMLTKSVAGSNLSDPLLWMALGLCAYAAWRPQEALGDADPAERQRARGNAPRHADAAVAAAPARVGRADGRTAL